MREIKQGDIFRAKKEMRMRDTCWNQSGIIMIPKGTLIYLGEAATRYGDVKYNTGCIIQEHQGGFYGGFMSEGWKTRHYGDLGIVDEDVWEWVHNLNEEERKKIAYPPHFRAGAWLYDPETRGVVEGKWNGWKKEKRAK